MTAPARITQADMDRAMKSVATAKLERARIIMDLKNSKITVIIGEAGGDSPDRNPWDDE